MTHTLSQREMGREIDRRLQAARTMAEDVGAMVAAKFRGTFETHHKTPTSAVTEVDQEAETRLRQAIHDAFPNDSIMGEEQGLDRRDEDWLWTLDPIDGTQNFIAGVPVFSVAIGVLYAGEPVVGVIHDPCRMETFAGARGRGTRLNGRGVRVDDGPLTPFSLLMVRHRFFRGPRERLLDELPTHKHRCLGSVCLEMAYVAGGSAAAALAGSIRMWEAVPCALLVEEAGGVALGLGGDPLFPVSEEAGAYVDRRLRLLVGGASAVETIAAELAKLPV